VLGNDTAAGSGAITIDGGTLDIGNQTVTNAVGFGGNGGVIKGSGNLSSSLVLDSTDQTRSPGSSPGILSLSASQTWESFTYEWELNSWPGSSPSDRAETISS